jgi:predicted nucleic acid-binding protein
VDLAEGRKISVVTYMELIQGARDRREVGTVKDFLTAQGIEVVPLSENVGHRTSIYVEEYGLSMALSVADALIAATAVEYNLTLCTGNRKHYKAIKDLNLKVFRPQ